MAFGEEYVHEFWEYFGNNNCFDELEDDSSDNLASEVLNYYGIPTARRGGGKLKNLDIKQMDAMTVVKLSLLDESAKHSKLLELVMNENGVVEFKEAGSYSGNISDIYHTIQTMSYEEKCSGVMITGGKPLPYRRDLKWSNIWGEDKNIFDTDQMNNSACVSDVFNQYASIVFPDPHLDSSYKDGIDNLYEINESNPYDHIIGYAYYHKIDEHYDSVDTVVTLVEECSVPLLIGDAKSPSVGELQRIPVEKESLINSGCWSASDTTEDIDIEKTVPIIIPSSLRYETQRGVKMDGFKGISKVYIIGQEVEKFVVGPKTFRESTIKDPKPENCNIYASIENTSMKPFMLEEGKHYIILYKDRDNDSYVEPYIAFANNAVFENPADFGDNVELFVDKLCSYYKESGASTTGLVCFLPTSIDSGILVNQIWAVLDISLWAIKIHDPQGFAKEIADTLVFLIAPLVEVSEPAPIAFNGTLLDLTDSIKDNDPTTQQDFEDTEFERALDEMSGGNGLTLSLSFLDEKGVVKLSNVLYKYMNSGDGQETTYVCGPNCNPKIGGRGHNGGIVNNITYSYSDSSSYTISVNEGQRVQTDFAQVSGGVSLKADEEVSAKGTIIQDMGNHIHFKVRIDGFGERVAINSCPEILRIGDKVSCSLHNVPVES